MVSINRALFEAERVELRVGIVVRFSRLSAGGAHDIFTQEQHRNDRAEEGTTKIHLSYLSFSYRTLLMQ